MRNNHRFYLIYEMDGKKLETDELYNRSQANIEKSILEEDGAKNVRIVRYKHLIFQDD